MWKDHFSTLLNTPDLSSKCTFELDNRKLDNVNCFTHDDISVAIKVLKSGKSGGKDGLRAEAFKHACKSIIVYLCILFNSIIYHGLYLKS